MKKYFIFLLLVQFIFGENITKIKSQIKKEYESFYKENQIKIADIILDLNPDTQINEVKIKDIILENKTFLSSGKVLIVFTFNNQTYKHLLRYKIQANLNVVYTQVGIKKSQDIMTKDVMIKNISIEELNGIPMGIGEVGNVSAKIFIPNQTIIYNYHIESKILIRKNESFLATYSEGNVVIQLVLIAKENGIKDSIIEAINPETKKVVRVKVLSDGNGKIL